MSELRYNIITRDWVIIASERAKRPSDFRKPRLEKAPLPKYRNDCPFCPGNEGDRSDETFRLGGADSWRTRVMYNKFPALVPTVKKERQISHPHRRISGYGVHEVIVKHPDHNTCIALMKYNEVEDIIRTYRSRYIDIQKMPDIEAITIFKNHGQAAGTSQEHPHSQLIATPIVPHHIRDILENAISCHDVTGECMFCQMLEQELAGKKRLVFETEYFVAFMPYAEISPFVTLIFPRRHSASFDEIADVEISDLAMNLKIVLNKLYVGLDNPDFNYTIRSAPVNEKWRESFHWYVSVIPRITSPAGFELGSGMSINASIPEESAEFLRRIKV
ncbi:MAG: galactose-1-phosphate uridylyltransferase [Candidatus Omnitrophica bacterium]|nr:galactose-1-phosphate uridylyltransferase [Candidatus Omnitrophota bacterium]MCM8791301.1 galactose-1-phosphate uridylyltransferase [Candidatus Omnitrophota bacterium]